MIDRELKNKKLTKALATLSTDISFKSQQSMLDINRVMEVILPLLLNRVYDIWLLNLNTIKYNHPAVDLGDGIAKIAVQVTSDGSRKKMNDTLDMYIRHGLDKQYETLWFMIISNNPKYVISRSGFNIKVKNFSDLSKDICELNHEKFEEIYKFCRQQFSHYFVEDNVSIFAPVTAPSNDPAPTITNFIDANKIDFNDYEEELSADDVRNDLIALKDKLAELNNDQRWFIYRVMNWSMTYDNGNEYCVVPFSVLASGMNSYDIRTLRETCDSLWNMRLAGFEEDIWRLQSAGYWVGFNKGTLPEFDYFRGITEYLITTEQRSKLRTIIVDCDFSVIN